MTAENNQFVCGELYQLHIDNCNLFKTFGRLMDNGIIHFIDTELRDPIKVMNCNDLVMILKHNTNIEYDAYGNHIVKVLHKTNIGYMRSKNLTKVK